MLATHALESLEATHALIVIGCRCGWVHTERKGFDPAAARKRARAALAAHKEAAS